MKRITLWGVLISLCGVLAGCVPIAPQPEATPSILPATPASPIAVSLADPGSPTSREVVISSPEATATPTIPATAPEVGASRTAVPAKQWRGFPIDLPDAAQAAQEEAFVMLETSASLDAVVAFYGERLQPAWVLFEQLWAEKTRFGGRAVLLLFGRETESVCILATNDPVVSNTKSLVTISTDCAVLRLTADDLLTAAWRPPGSANWRQWSGDGGALQHPADYRTDPRLSQLALCRPDSGIQCLLGLTRRGEAVEGILTLISEPRPLDESLLDSAIKTWEDGAEATPGLTWVAGQMIQLDDGTEAVQIDSTIAMGDGLGIITTIKVASDDVVYMLTGSAFGESEVALAESELLRAMMRSFHLTDQ